MGFFNSSHHCHRRMHPRQPFTFDYRSLKVPDGVDELSFDGVAAHGNVGRRAQDKTISVRIESNNSNDRTQH